MGKACLSAEEDRDEEIGKEFRHRLRFGALLEGCISFLLFFFQVLVPPNGYRARKKLSLVGGTIVG